MLSFFISPLSFILLLSFFAIGAGGSLLLRKTNTLANVWGNVWAMTGSLYGVVFSGSALILQKTFSFAVGNSPFSLLKFSFHIDMLALFFIFIISLIALFCSLYSFGYIKHFYKKYSIGALGFFYNLMIASLLLVVTASNGLFFLIAWELMSIASYFLVVYDRHDAENIKAGSLYLVMTYIGTACIMVMFLLAYKYTGSFDFSVIQSAGLAIPLAIKNAIFVCALIGFGTKAGIIPFHIWLPAAHPAAPSHISAMMSGVMIKTGIYMMIRLFLEILQPAPLWWGLTVLVIGSVATLLGVLYALTEHDIKKLLAYHSIENIGIILLGVGSALTFYALDMPTLALLGLMAALFHTINHAIFKSLLFLSAGAVVSQMHTRNMEEYGGLIRYMPQTALLFLIGSMAISALPPFNGFFSEWLTFQTLFQGIAQVHFYAQWFFIAAAASLAFTGGLALACFVKAFGVIFLARPRSEEVKHAKEVSVMMRFGMAGLAVLSLIFGLFSGYITSLLVSIGHGFTIFTDTPSVVSSVSYQITVASGFASVSAPYMFIFMLSIVSIVVFIVTRVINRNQKITRDITWDCGTTLLPRMEITATGFARSIVLIFQGILKPSIQHEIEYHDAKSRYLPKSRMVTLSIGNMYQTYLYQPLYAVVNSASLHVRNIQGGNINVYISYIFVTLIIALFSIL